MVKRQGTNWGLRALICAAIIVWQIYDFATARVFSSTDGDTMRYLINGAALVGLVASLVKLSVDY